MGFLSDHTLVTAVAVLITAYVARFIYNLVLWRKHYKNLVFNFNYLDLTPVDYNLLYLPGCVLDILCIPSWIPALWHHAHENCCIL